MLFGTFKNPKGPSWKEPEKVVLNLSGTTVELQLPRSNFISPPEAMGDKIEFGNNQYALDVDNIISDKRQKNSLLNSTGELVFDHQLRRVFNFKGLPIVGESTGCLHLLLSICYNTKKSFKGCFYETFFQHLEKIHGKKATKGYLRRLYPIDWSLININNAQLLNYGVEDFVVQHRKRSAFRIEFICPISEDVSLFFKFKFGSIPVESGGISLAHELIQKIMQTFVIDYKPEHKKQVATLDLKETFEPIKPVVWDNYKKAPRVDYSVLDNYL
ncbi:hypothetical protein [Marinibactrum halimedae]|uniref:Uncharacterized protein n=1 Tax=Marinibactrum halimedae TaxID=1444977 RepID=A0AA37WNR3_9GAMM|nr:hypothetical protein [Marinibactrum halimedae]MCD9461353.1 hypothetical protein [Marinibactrum halimedae]GLS26406.1 hypothetical protein GCM10007877_21210 [Marinibactrum halimedae]